MATFVDIVGRQRVAIDLWQRIETSLRQECEENVYDIFDEAPLLPSKNKYYTSRWHDYDYIYKFNDYLVETTACPGDWDYYKSYAQDVSECK